MPSSSLTPRPSFSLTSLRPLSVVAMKLTESPSLLSSNDSENFAALLDLDLELTSATLSSAFASPSDGDDKDLKVDEEGDKMVVEVESLEQNGYASLHPLCPPTYTRLLGRYLLFYYSHKWSSLE
jgi:hypothetical protein